MTIIKETRKMRPKAGKLVGRTRKEQMERLIRDRGSMSIADLAHAFRVSEMTVRRDLSELEERGQIQRTHGGAIMEPERNGRTGKEPFFDERRNVHADGKKLIARRAQDLIQPHQSLAIDVGTTTYELAMLLAGRTDIRVFTNNLRVATLTGEHAIEIYLIGGRVRQKEMSLCGPVAVEQARKLWFDIAFLGVSGISESGVFDYSIEETELKRAYIERSTRRVVLADSSKFDRISLVQVSALDQIDVLVTDAEPPEGLRAKLIEAGVQIIVCD